MTAKPGAAVNYVAQARDLVDSYQPDEGENGWAAMLEAIAAYERAAFEDEDAGVWSDAFSYINEPSGLDSDARATHRPRGTHHRSPSPQLHRAARRLGLARRDGRRPRFARPLPPSGRMVMLLLPELGKMRTLARAITADMHFAHEAGDDARAVSAATRGFALAKGCAQQLTIIDRLVGLAISALMLNEIRDELIARPYSPEQLDELAKLFDRYELPSLKLAFEGEHLSILDSIQWTHTDNGRGNGRLIVSQAQGFVTMGGPTPSVLPAGLVNLASIAFPSKRQTTLQANEMFELLYEQAEMPRQQRLRQADSADAYVMGPAQASDAAAHAHARAGKDHRDPRLPPNDLRGHPNHGRDRTLQSPPRPVPESLDNLKPDQLSQLPIDPYAKDGRFHVPQD